MYIGVSPTPLHISVRFDQMLRSGTYDGAGRMLEGVNGRCSKGLLISTWSVYYFLPGLLHLTRWFG